MPTTLADPRRRRLAVLGGIALVSLILVVFVVWQQAREAANRPAQTEFLPGFASEVRNVSHLHIASKAGAFDVVFLPEKGWVVPQRDDYPANFDLVQRTRVGLAALQTIEPRTARKDWLHFLGLDSPPLGDGVLITASDDKGKKLAELITGKSEDIGDPSGATGLFVRRAGENQSWLTRAVFEPRPALTDWLDKRVMDVDRARIQEVDIDPAGSPSYVVTRAKPSDADFTLSPLPAGKAPSDPTIPDGVASAITDFAFDDVRPARDFDFSNPATHARVVTKTFDGQRVTVQVVKSGNDYWATVSADALNPMDHENLKEAATINTHASGWAYKLSAFKGQLFMTTLDSLLKPPPAPPQGMPAMGSP
jgi:hypothetical protein